MNGQQAGISRAGTDKMLARLSRSLTTCCAHVQAYGACVQKLVPEASAHIQGPHCAVNQSTSWMHDCSVFSVCACRWSVALVPRRCKP